MLEFRAGFHFLETWASSCDWDNLHGRGAGSWEFRGALWGAAGRVREGGLHVGFGLQKHPMLWMLMNKDDSFKFPIKPSISLDRWTAGPFWYRSRVDWYRYWFTGLALNGLPIS